MYRKPLVMLCSAAALAVVLTVSPAEAQGKGKGKGNKKNDTRVEARAGDRYDDRYRDDRYDDERYDDRYRTARSTGNGSGKVPPGWCKGKGNPHNTRENCGYRSDGRYDDRYGRDRYGRSGSYERDHADFHYYLDRKYSDLSRGRALDVPAQIELRMRKKAEHDEFHRQTGTRH